jgi:polar amino acid transport system substrate-binding protein
MPRLSIWVLAFALAASATGLQARADKLTDIDAKGEIVIGVNNGFQPFGYVDEAGNTVGFEIDLAKGIADWLGVKLRLQPISAGNRTPWLKEGKIDMILASMPASQARKADVGVIDPPYYASGVAILAPAKAAIKSWAALKDRPVCGLKDATFNKRVVDAYGAKLVAFASTSEIEAALADGRCQAWVFDEAVLAARLTKSERWQGYELPLAAEDRWTWAIAVPAEDKNGPYGKLISGIVADWHRTGKLIELQRRWGLRPASFLEEQHQRYR